MASMIFRRWPTATDSNLLEIVGSQTGQDVQVDPVIAKCLLVGLQAEAAQPLPDFHVAPTPQKVVPPEELYGCSGRRLIHRN